MAKISNTTHHLAISLAQINPIVADIANNAKKIIEHAQKICQHNQPDLIVFPEFALTGYPLEDLLYRNELHQRIEQAISTLLDANLNCHIAFGCPTREGGQLYNSMLLIKNQSIIGRYHKHHLPNYTVFDEKRYFQPGTEVGVFRIKDVPIGFMICEDMWHDDCIQSSIDQGAKCIISLNASPFAYDKEQRRSTRVKSIAKKFNIPILYSNLVGGQDELVFDGGSFASDVDGNYQTQLNYFEEESMNIAFDPLQPAWIIPADSHIPVIHGVANIYQALVRSVTDYIRKNGFSGALIGLSGGIDSALMLAIAADALGADCITAVMMPSEHTAAMSIEDATEEANRLGVHIRRIDIDPIYQRFVEQLQRQEHQPDVVEQNLQARCRGTLLMALSNETGQLVLATGNRSEMAVGYTTLYGDMVGGFAALKDVPKTLVYKLAAYRNRISKVIPDRVISRPPSAELAPNQVDQDNLPPYDILDDILYRYINLEQSEANIIAETGFNKETVHQVICKVLRNEYKRRQAPIGVRISTHAFGKDRRYPITSIYF